MVVFYLFTSSTFGGWSVGLYVVALLYASMLFNPQERIAISHSLYQYDNSHRNRLGLQALSVSNIKQSFSELQTWLLSSDEGDTWSGWHAKRLTLARDSSFIQKIG